jgi:hypothetical protein
MKIKILCLTKNESILIEPFIKYYGNIFGYSNLIIVDNNSTDEKVLEIYKKYREKGITIEYEKSTNYKQHGKWLSYYSMKYKDTYDYLIIADTDEFLVYNNNGVFTSHNIKQVLIDELNKNKDIEVFQIKLRNYICNDINVDKVNDALTFDKSIGNTSKCIRKSKNKFSITNGNHHPEASESCMSLTNLEFLHYHRINMKEMYEKAFMHCVGFGYINQNDSILTQYTKLTSCKSGDGKHRMNQCIQYLKNKISLNKFITLHKRLPSLKELKEFREVKCEYNSYNLVNDNIKYDIKKYDELLYNFIFNPNTITLTCVRDYLEQLE